MRKRYLAPLVLSALFFAACGGGEKKQIQIVLALMKAQQQIIPWYRPMPTNLLAKVSN